MASRTTHPSIFQILWERISLSGGENRIPFGLRIGIYSALLSGAALFTFIVASSTFVFDSMTEEADYALSELAKDLLRDFNADPPDRDALQSAAYRAPLNATMSDIRILAYLAPAHDLVWYSAEPAWQRSWLQGKRVFRRERTVWWRFTPWRVRATEADDGRQIVLVMDIYEVEDEIWRMTKGYLAALPITIAIVGAGAWWITKRSLRPVERLADAMESVTLGDLDERLPPSTVNDELGRLTTVFNRMMRRLQASFEQTGRFTSDASHELRTPITVLQGNLEKLLQTASPDQADDVARLLRQVERLRGIVEALLLLSKSDSGRLIQERSDVDLSALLEDSTQHFAVACEEAGLRLETDIPPHLFVEGHRQLLRQAIGNLIGNAVKFNRASNGQIHVSLGKQDGHLEIEVASTGQPIPKEDRDRIFTRFYRGHDFDLSDEPPGSGLGLSIVKAVAESHHGDVHYQWDEAKRRNRFVLRLPETP